MELVGHEWLVLHDGALRAGCWPSIAAWLDSEVSPSSSALELGGPLRVINDRDAVMISARTGRVWVTGAQTSLSSPFGAGAPARTPALSATSSILVHPAARPNSRSRAALRAGRTLDGGR